MYLRLSNSFVCFNSIYFQQEYREKMAVALREEESPLDADLEKVLPGVHQRLNAQTSAINQIKEGVTEGMSGIAETILDAFEKQSAALDDSRKASDRRLAGAFLHCAVRLLKGNVNGDGDGEEDALLSALLDDKLNSLLNEDDDGDDGMEIEEQQQTPPGSPGSPAGSPLVLPQTGRLTGKCNDCHSSTALNA